MNTNQKTGVLLGILILCGTVLCGCVTSSTTTNTSSSDTIPARSAQQSAMTGDTVSVYYTGMAEDGTVFSSNMNATPLTFVLGNASVIDGFNDAVIGMTVNEEKTVTIPFEKAYGPYRMELIRIVPRVGPLANTSFTAGQHVTITRKTDNAVSVVKILNVTKDTVVWDENNALAGQNLTYTIRLVTIGK